MYATKPTIIARMSIVSATLRYVIVVQEISSPDLFRFANRGALLKQM
jgi:hypothetical protein